MAQNHKKTCYSGVRKTKKTALGKFDAKVFFEVRRTLIDVVFGEESGSEVKMIKNP